MRPKLKMRKSRPVQATVGALMLAIPSTAVALTAASTGGQAAAATAVAQSAPPVILLARRLSYGHDVTLTGTASPADAGQMLVLEFAAAGSSSWRPLNTGRIDASGRFRLVAPLQQSGLVRVVGASSASTTRAVAATSATSTSTSGGTSASVPRRVAVAAELRVSAESLNVLGGQAVDLRGRLLPGVGGRQVRLEARQGGGWHALATTHTGPMGGFRLRYVTAALGRQPLRVRFAGDERNMGVSSPAGWLTVYRETVASWYDDGGSTACGFHASFGVANKGLPCGTQVTFRFGGRSVTAVVDDRGPYVGGREWDLNQNTAAALGFGGVDTVWSSS